MLKERMKMRQAGDTIVEVLICIAIVGLILAGAFVVTNRSQTGVRNSQEHAEASKLVESQLEQLRGNTATGGAIFSFAGAFCMVNATPVSATNAQCKVDSGGSPTTNQPQYIISINRDSNGSGAESKGRVFTILVRWASVTGSAQDSTETMQYRLYP